MLLPNQSCYICITNHANSLNFMSYVLVWLVHLLLDRSQLKINKRNDSRKHTEVP